MRRIPFPEQRLQNTQTEVERQLHAMRDSNAREAIETSHAHRRIEFNPIEAFYKFGWNDRDVRTRVNEKSKYSRVMQRTNVILFADGELR